MASGLVALIGGGLLVMYYVHAASSSAAPHPPRPTASEHVQGDLALPSLGRIQGPPRSTVIDPAILPSVPGVESASEPPGGVSEGTVSPRKQVLDRRLTGSVFEGSVSRVSAVSTPGAVPSVGVVNAPAVAGVEVGSLLHASEPVAARAYLVPTRRLLLPKGAFIDCTLETAIDSTLPGMTTCITATDTFGMDGSTVLLERGTKLIGETRGQVRQGSARVFVVWTEARTPAGVVVPLDSPATDELGRSGLAGEVDRHFWDRFGAAILISIIDGAVQSAVQSSSHGGSTILYSPSASEDIVTEVLKSTVEIPPTVRKSNGDRVQVLVARDVDFRGVYELR